MFSASRIKHYQSFSHSIKYNITRYINSTNAIPSLITRDNPAFVPYYISSVVPLSKHHRILFPRLIVGSMYKMISIHCFDSSICIQNGIIQCSRYVEFKIILGLCNSSIVAGLLNTCILLYIFFTIPKAHIQVHFVCEQEKHHRIIIDTSSSQSNSYLIS